MTAEPASPRLDRDGPADRGARLMVAYQRGSEEAFDELVRLYSGQVHAFLTRFVGPVAEREDLVQDVFLRVVRARDRYEPTARFSTWLYRIAFNLCVSRTERASPRERPLEDVEQGRPVASAFEPDGVRDLDPAQRLERADVVRAVRAAIAALPETQRMAIVLAKYHELPYAEIAQVLDSSEKAVKSLIHRARESLRERLAPFLQRELP